MAPLGKLDVCAIILRQDHLHVMFECPGCKCSHSVPTDGSRGWTWNQDLIAPTISPSILVTWEFGERREKKVCHSYVKDGNIIFLTDCTHKLAGQTVPLEHL